VPRVLQRPDGILGRIAAGSIRMHPNQTEYDRKSRAKKREAGLKQFLVWAPEKDGERLKKYAAKLCREHEKTHREPTG